LIELVVTMVILSVGLVGVASTFVVAYKTQVRAHFASVATDIACSKLEEMKAAGYNGIDAESFPPQFLVPELPSGGGTIAYTPYPNADSPNQYQITVTVSWGGGSPIAGSVSLPLVLSNHS